MQRTSLPSYVPFYDSRLPFYQAYMPSDVQIQDMGFERPKIKAVNSLPGPLTPTSLTPNSDHAVQGSLHESMSHEESMRQAARPIDSTPLFSSYFYTLQQKDLMLCSPFMPRSTKWIEIDANLPSSTISYLQCQRTSRSLPSSPREPFLMEAPAYLRRNRGSLGCLYQQQPQLPSSCANGDIRRIDKGGARDGLVPSSRSYDWMPCSPTSDESVADCLLSLKPQ